MAHYHLGLIYFEYRDFEKAANSFKRVLREDPEDSASAEYLELISDQVEALAVN